jgi:WD40 repeat protein
VTVFSDLPTPPPPVTLPGSDGYYPTDFSPDGRLLHGTGPHWGARDHIVWDVAASLTLYEKRLTDGGAAFAPDGRLARTPLDRALTDSTGKPQSKLVLCDVRTRWEEATAVAGLAPQLFDRLAFSPDGSLLAALDAEGRLCVWEVATGAIRVVWRPTEDAQSPTYFRFSADGSSLGMALANATVHVWDPSTGRQRALVEVPDPRRPFLYCTLSPDLTKLLAVSRPGSVALAAGTSVAEEWKLWSLGTVSQLAEGSGRAWFHVDGRVVTWEEVPHRESLLTFWRKSAGSPASDLVYRDAESGEVMATVPGGKDGILSSDGRAFAARMDDGTVKFWVLPAWGHRRLSVGEVMGLAVVVGLLAGALTWWLSRRTA